ncbi:MAG: gephyrin-like molybdotransferase Glp [Bacteroidales bacterium]
MITVEKAFEVVMGINTRTGTENVLFRDAAGRILAMDVSSDMDMPPFNRAAVDGFACHRSDLDNELEIIEVIRAGKEPEKKAGINQCAKIMTGAIVPEGCDFVFMVEDSKILSSGKVIYTGKPLKPNMSLKGEDVKRGEIVLRKGKLLKPQDIAVLAAVGCVNVKVAVKPSIGILSTGDELVEPEEKPGRSRIRNTNAFQLLAQAERAGASGKYYGIAPDDEEKTYRLIVSAISENNVVLLTGGVSMGDFDFVPSVLKKAGVEILFDQVNVQPGKPTTFGVHPHSIIFGLPGNPVSAFTQFETLVRPLISKMMGHTYKPEEKFLAMAVSYERKQSFRVAWLPVMINENNEVIPVEYHGSAHITAFPYADGIVKIASGKTTLKKGEKVIVRQI